MKRLFLLFFSVNSFLYSQTSSVKSLIYPQLKPVDVTSIDYTALLGEKNVPKDFNLDYPKRVGKDILAMNDCVEGNCSSGEGVLLYIEKIEPINPNPKNTKDLKENVDRFYDEYWKARDKRKKFNTQKYYIPYQDKLMANDCYAITYVLLKGSFSDEGQKFNGEKHVYEVNYNRNGKEFIPEVNLNFSELNKSNLTYGGEMKREYNKTYKYHGLGRNYLLETDPTIEKIVGLFGSGYPKMISITYAPGQELKSFLGIPSRRFYMDEEDVGTSLRGKFIFGRITFNDGLEYIGGMIDDTYNGIGRLTNPDGTIEQGVWVKGQLYYEGKVTFPEVLLTNDFTNLSYKTISLKHEVYDTPEEYFYFGNLAQNQPSGLGMYMTTTYDIHCFVGEIFNQIPGKSYFYYNDYHDKFKSGIQLDKNRWLGTAFSDGAPEDVASGFFKVGEMASSNSFKDMNTAIPNLTYSNSCIKVLPNNEKQNIGYFQFPEGWYQSVTGKFSYLTNYQHLSRYVRYFDAEDKDFVRKASKETIEKMYANNTFCSPDFTLDKKMAIIENQEEKHRTSERVQKEMAEYSAKREAAAKAFNGCWKPQIVMNSDPSKTYTLCNGHKTYGELKDSSKIFNGDIVQHNGIMYEVKGSYYGGLTLSCDLLVSGRKFYVFDKLKQAKGELLDHCDCTGYEYVTRSYRAPTTVYSTVYQSSTVTLVRESTSYSGISYGSTSYKVKVDCKKQCGGVLCWPSDYAKGY